MEPELEEALQAVTDLPPERQRELADLIQWVVRQDSPADIAELRAAIDEGLADADAGRFVSDTEVERLFPSLVR